MRGIVRLYNGLLGLVVEIHWHCSRAGSGVEKALAGKQVIEQLEWSFTRSGFVLLLMVAL